MNNFQDLYDRNTDYFHDDQQKIARDVWKTLGVFKFVGQIVDAYVPKLVDLFVAISGGDISKANPNNPTTDPGSDPDTRGPRDSSQWAPKTRSKRV